MATKIEFKLDGTEKILDGLGLKEGGAAQMFFTSELMRLSDPYVPFRQGELKSSARIAETKDAIIYDTPYARYLYYGKLYVDPITGKGAFYNPSTGRFWSRPKTPKVPTDRDLQFSGAPLRGARWVERAWIDNKRNIIASTEQFIRRYHG